MINSNKCRLLAFLMFISAFMAGNSYGSPNIILIMADDLGWSDTSDSLTNLGNPDPFVETPAIERIACEGLVFTNAYTNGPNCAPTRAAILTGQYATRPTNNVYQVGNLNRANRPTMLVGPPQGLANGLDAISAHVITYAECISETTNYVTAHIGKFHVTEDAASITEHHGFDINIGGKRSGHPGSYHANKNRFKERVGEELNDYSSPYDQIYIEQNINPFSSKNARAHTASLIDTQKHVSDAMTDAAIEFIEASKEGNFLLQFHPYAVHTPVGNEQARKDLLRKYQDKANGISASDSYPSYSALVEGMDQNLARILNYLDRTDDPSSPGNKLSQNTILIFYSDNGGRLPHSNTGPLKGQKGELSEGGIRVPLIAWSANPNLVSPSSLVDTPVSGIDLFPTILNLVGGYSPSNKILDGEDLSPLLKDPKHQLKRECLYWHLPGYLIDKDRNQLPQSVIRWKDWKLIYNYEDHSYELYNLIDDISESKNLANDNNELVKLLSSKLANWLAETNAPLAKLQAGSKTIDLDGKYYSQGEICDLTGKLIIMAGDEMPLMLP